MTTKSQLTLSVVIVLGVTFTVVLARVIGMGFVKSKLVDLTEKSTPGIRRIRASRGTEQ